MVENIHEMVQEYLKTNPRVKKLMEDFRVSQAEYEKALAAMHLGIRREDFYTLTTKGNYNANVSSTN